MSRPSREVVDIIFNAMTELYGGLWTENFIRPGMKSEFLEDLAKTMWGNALIGLDDEDINLVLEYCERQCKKPGSRPPTHMQFFVAGKRLRKVSKKT